MRLTIKHSEPMGDWFTIECAEHDGRQWIENTGPSSAALRCSSRFSDACVEGDWEQMQSLAAAIETRGRASHKRCSVRVDGDRVFFRSPRNSQQDGECTLTEADELAALIRATEKPAAS